MLDLLNTTYLHLSQETDKMRMINFRKDNSVWQIDFYSPIDGKRIRKATPFAKSDKHKARVMAEEYYMRLYLGETLSQNKTPFREIAEEYYSARKPCGTRYRFNILIEQLGEIPISALSPKDIQKLKRYLGNRPMKNQSINRYLNELRAVLNMAKKNGYIRDFCPIIALPEDTKRPTRAISYEEQNTLIEAMKELGMDYLIDPFLFAISSGFRRSNIIHLQKKHLVKIDGLYTIKFKPQEMKDKTRAFTHFTTMEETEIIKRNISFESKYIFKGYDGKWLGDFKKSWISVRNKSGISICWHDLRHTRATRYGEQGVNEANLNSLMAWSPKSRMAGEYMHLSASHLSNLRQELENKDTHRTLTDIENSHREG